MPLGGQIGSGVRAGYSMTSPMVWTRINQIQEADPPTFERDDVETTVHGTTGIRQEIPGLSTVSDARLLLLADFERITSPSHLGLKDLERSQATVWFRFEIPVTANLATTTFFVYEFQARVKSWVPATPIDDRKTIEVLMKFGGADIYQYENAPSAFGA